LLSASMSFMGLRPVTFEATEIPRDTERLVEFWLERWRVARGEKNWSKADSIRVALGEAGISVDFALDGKKWDIPKTFDPSKLESLE